jgi:hypothetical protein
MPEQVRRVHRRVWPAVLIASVLIATVVGAAVAWASGGEPRSWVYAPEVDGSTVTVTYSDSPCRTFERVDVDEANDEVTITVRTWTFASSCNDSLQLYSVEVRLEAPLGERSLVDGAA